MLVTIIKITLSIVMLLAVAFIYSKKTITMKDAIKDLAKVLLISLGLLSIVLLSAMLIKAFEITTNKHIEVSIYIIVMIGITVIFTILLVTMQTAHEIKEMLKDNELLKETREALKENKGTIAENETSKKLVKELTELYCIVDDIKRENSISDTVLEEVLTNRQKIEACDKRLTELNEYVGLTECLAEDALARNENLHKRAEAIEKDVKLLLDGFIKLSYTIVNANT